MLTHPTVYDTDIGVELSDAFALALLCRSRAEIGRTAVTVGFGDVAARAVIAREIIEHASPSRVPEMPVYGGCFGTMASQPDQEALSAHLCYGPVKGLPIANVSGETPDSGIDHHAMALREGRAVLTTGPLTNLGVSLLMLSSIGWKNNNPKVICVAGNFEDNDHCRYVRQDPEAARLVFQSGLPVSTIPPALAKTLTLCRDDLERLEASEHELPQLLVQFVRDCHGEGDLPESVAMTDVASVLALLDESLFTWQQGEVTVHLGAGEQYGLTSFSRGDGAHRVAIGLDHEAAHALLMEKLLAAPILSSQ